MKNTSVEIRQVANGYILMPPPSPGCMVDHDNMRVFQTFAELTDWLQSHFTHRSNSIFCD